MSSSAKLEDFIETLVDLNVTIYSCHDLRDFAGLEKASSRVLTLLDVPHGAAQEGGKIVSKMYSLYDEADILLRSGDKIGHNKIFSLIFEEAQRLDRVIKIKKGSTADEIYWWYHFSLAFDKSDSRFIRLYHYFAAFVAAFRQHHRRLESISYGFLCALSLAREGLAHKYGDSKREKDSLRKYWSTKVKGNGFRIGPEIFSM